MAGFHKKRKHSSKRNLASLIYIVFGLSLVLSMVITIVVMNHTSKVSSSFDDLVGTEAIDNCENDTEKAEVLNNEKTGEDGEVEKSSSDKKMLTSNQDSTETDADAEEPTYSEHIDVTPGEYHAGGKLEGTNGKTVYITFDDGPSPYTDKILDILAEKNVKATFFVVNTGEQYYDSMKRIVDEGHTIAMHSNSHIYSEIYSDLPSFKNDVTSIHDLIYSVTGFNTKYYRFPGGSTNQVSNVPIRDCIEYLNEKGYVYFDWNALNDDTVNLSLSADELNSRALGYVRRNSGDTILLLHDLEHHEGTVEALPTLIDTLIEEGYSIAAIDDDTPLIRHFSIDEDE